MFWLHTKPHKLLMDPEKDEFDNILSSCPGLKLMTVTPPSTLHTQLQVFESCL